MDGDAHIIRRQNKMEIGAAVPVPSYLMMLSSICMRDVAV